MFSSLPASGFDITKRLINDTCLHLVANCGTLAMAYLVLSRAAPTRLTAVINAIDTEQRSAIMYAVVGERNDILRLLVQCGGDVTVRGANGMTALHLAAKNGNFEAATIMLEQLYAAAPLRRFDAFLNASDDGGWTAAVWAAEIGHTEMVAYLIGRGADVNVCDAEQNTVMHWAALSDNVETCAALMAAERCDFDVQNVSGDTPL